MKKVVIVGGGFAGARIANSLQGKFHVTLIDTKNFFEFTPGITRTLTNPNYRRFIEIHHRKYLKNANFHHDSVTNIDKKFVYTSKGEKILYDYLIICTGSKYNQPFKGENVFLADRAKDLIESHKRIHNSKKILVIGGGLVGVEIAAELANKYKHKKITLIEAGEKIMGRNTEKTRSYVMKFLETRGVNIILNEKVVSYTKVTAVTDKNRKMRADMILLCVGIVPNSEFLRKNFSRYLDERGHLKVNNELLVKGLKNIFAVGDINDVAEEKSAQAAEKQAKVVIRNIKRLEKGGTLKSYHPSKKPMVITLGKWKGIFEYKNFVWTGILPSILRTFIQLKTMIRYRFSFFRYLGL